MHIVVHCCCMCYCIRVLWANDYFKRYPKEESSLPCPDCGGKTVEGYMNIMNWD